MSEFNPSPHDRLVIGGRVYRVMPHPSVPSFAFGQEGRKAFVYQLADDTEGSLWALKKFKLAYRLPDLVEVCNGLARFAAWPGLEVCARQCLNQKAHLDALGNFPDLEYAVLMPWITGSTWYDIVIGGKPLTRQDALGAANSTAQVLAALEESGLAHCDIAAPNVIVNLATGRTHLIDVEDLYSAGFSAPAALPAGSGGYAHRTAPAGLWEPAADRFAGAVILAEMAAWHSPDVRKASDEEHFFADSEMQQDCPRYRLMTSTLAVMDPHLAGLFTAAWGSETLPDCPRLKDWQSVIGDLFQRERVSKVVSNWEPISVPSAEEAAPARPIEPLRAAAAQTVPAEAPRPAPQPTIVRQAPASPPARPIAPPAGAGKIQSAPTGSPVLEWRPLIIPVSPAPAPQPASAPPIQAPPAAPAGEPESVLLKPVLDLSHVDKRNRPFLVWSESQGADRYLLQESDNPDFSQPREHQIKGKETRWHPTFGRSGRLFYRVQAWRGDQASPWSQVLSVRIAGG